MKLSQLKDVLAVANKRSFRAAARHLHMTQPAISRSIHELERDLGILLFDRHARGAMLTPLGERFVQRASAALAELQRARDEITQLQGEGMGTVVACLSSGAQAKLLPAALTPFLQRYPGVQLQLIEGQYKSAELGLKDGNIDFYIGPEPEAGIDSELVTEHLYENHLMIIARKGHPLSGVQSLDDLKDAEWLGATTGHEVDNLTLAFSQQNVTPPRVAMLAGTIQSIALSVMNSDLLALVPYPLARLAAPLGLTTIQLKTAIRGPRSVLVRRFGMPLTPAAEFFCDMLRRANQAPDGQPHP
ncbi:MAG: LysR family transcriptional regulator [Pseudomonadota bacterium]